MRISESPRCVYRCYTPGFTLLYVGSTNQVAARLEQHQQSASWMTRTEHVIENWYGSVAEGLAVESFAIASEHPLHNIQGQGFKPFEVNARLVSPINPAYPRRSATGDRSLHIAVAAAVNNLMVAKEVTLFRIHKDTRVPLRTLHRYLSGDKPMTVGHLARFADLLGVEVSDLTRRAEGVPA